MHTVWAVRQLKRYTAFAPKVEVVAREPEMLHVVKNHEQHYKLAALLIELSMYHVEWVDAGQVPGLVSTFLQPELLMDATSEKGEELKTPQWVHPGDYEVVHPADQSQEGPDVTTLAMCVASFDGGAAQKLGVGGYCVQDAAGKLHACRGVWYGKANNTNNEAEC